MSIFTSTPQKDISNGLSLVNALSLTLNPYPLILQTIVEQKKKLSHPDLPMLAMRVGVVHSVLLIVAVISFLLKVFRRHNGERRKIWLWRKKYGPHSTSAYLVPNSFFMIELLQICGCICYILFVSCVYSFAKHPESTSDIVHAGILFWQAVALVPGAIGFWISGWSAFYVVYLVPNQVDVKDAYSRMKSIIRNPLVMNTICISVPVLIITYFVGFGIALFVKLKQTITTFELLQLTLNQLTVQWKPNDPVTIENNIRLFDIITTLTVKANQLYHIAQAELVGWATVSILIIAFYIGSAIASGKLVKRSMSFMACGKQSIIDDQRSESQDKLKESINSRCKTEDSNSARFPSGTPGKTSQNGPSQMQRLRRSYYYIHISCVLMTVFLGLNFASNVTYLAKMKMVVIETQWQARLAQLETWTTALLSSSLFLQSLMLTIWG